MDFSLSDEQQLLVDTARALFANECPPELVRGLADTPDLAGRLFDRHLRDWVALSAVPPDSSMVDLTLFLVEAGAAVAPGPFLATAGLFVPLLRAGGHDLAEAATTGEVTGTVAVAGPDGVWSVPFGDAGDDNGDDNGSSGVGARQRSQVVDLPLVDHLAIVTPGPGLAVVAADSVPAHPVESLDLARTIWRIELTDEVLADAQPLEPEALDDALERMALAVAADALGAARWLIDTSVQYAKERIQFGKPIGSFQAIQHKLVDASLAYEEAAAAMAYAAMCVDADDPDRHRAVHVAKAMAGRAARRAARDGIQTHGGIGYTWEHDLHYRLRRAYGDDALVGTHEWHLDRLADLLWSA